jgi:hypothetical protein
MKSRLQIFQNIQKARILLGFLLLTSTFHAFSQVKVTGSVVDIESGRQLPHAFVINHRTQNGVFCDYNGKFSITVNPSDSLLVSLTGYQMVKVLLSDSIPKSEYKINVRLKFKPVALKSFTVRPPKTYDEILKELAEAEKLKVKETPLVNAIESPITFLYMQFSKEGKAIRKIAELRADDAKTELLKELFTKYMVAHIIDTDENEMDDFIKFSGLKNNYNTFETEYELVSYVKQRWADYKIYRGMED